MAKKPLMCDSCGQETSTTVDKVVLNFGMTRESRAGYKGMPIYNRERIRTHSFHGFPPLYLHVGVIALCKYCRVDLSCYFSTTVYGSGVEINRMLIDESKETPAKVISLFKRWILEFLKHQIKDIYADAQDRGAKIVSVSYESLNDIFARHKVRSKLVLSALNELVEEKFLARTKKAEKTIFWGPVRVERIQIDLVAPPVLCSGEMAHFSLISSHGGFIRIRLFENARKITEINQEIAANKKRSVDIRFPAPGNYKVLAKYLRVEKARLDGVPGLILKSTKAIKKLEVKVRSKRPSLDIENPFVDALNPAKLKFVTNQGSTTRNIIVDINGKILGRNYIKRTQGRFDVTLRGNIESIPRVHLLSLKRIVNGECSCPASAEVIAFKIERPEKFRIGEKSKIKMLFPRTSEHVKMSFEVGWKKKGDFAGGIFKIPLTGRLELETPPLEGRDELVLRLQNPLRPNEKAEFAYRIKVEPTTVKVESKPVKAGSPFTVRVIGGPFLLDELKTQVIAKSTGPVQITKQRIADNSILVKGVAYESDDYIIDLQSPIPFKSKGDKSFYVRIPPKLITDKHEYEMGKSLKLILLYDPRMSVETIQSDVSYYNYFSKSKESVRFERTIPGRAEAIVQALPPCTAEISVVVVYKGEIKDLIKKNVDIYGVLLKSIER